MNWEALAAEQLSWGVVDESWRKGPWTTEEDGLLIGYVRQYGEGRWNSVAELAGLRRNGKSCRLRWVNYLRPDLKRGQITQQEESMILELHARWGNRWSMIARSLPGRTDNEIKNYWRAYLRKKAKGSPNRTSGKTKSRLLRRQQFQQRKKQQQQQFSQADLRSIASLQFQQQQFNQIDIRKVTALDESNNTISTLPQVSQDTATLYPHHVEEQGFCSEVCAQEVANEENDVWDELWSLEDIHAGWETSKTSFPCLPAHYS